MINITITNNSIDSSGHAQNEPCARVSTVLQLVGSMLEKVEDFKVLPGRTTLKIESMTKTERKYYNICCDALVEFGGPNLYPNMVKVTDNREA